MKGSQKINVVYITDERYADITATSITSLRINRDKTAGYSVYVILVEVKKEVSDKFLKMQETGFDVYIIPYNLSEKKNEYEILGISASPAAIVKFCLADILHFLDKVIYLDGDTLVLRDLQELYNIDLEESQYAAAVSEGQIGEIPQEKYIEQLGDNLECYFNSGVLLLNLDRIRADGLRNKLFDYRKNGKNYFMDQDALNVVFGGNVKFISCKFNYMGAKQNIYAKGELRGEPEINHFITKYERFAEAVIIHLITENNAGKPWKVYEPYLSELFVKYYNLSPFANEQRYNIQEIKKVFGVQYLFPFELIRQKSRIIIWGAGKVGTAYYKQLMHTHYCDVVLWLDENWEKYKAEHVVAPENLRNTDFDFIVIAIKRGSLAQEIRETIMDMGVAEEKIIWRYPVVL